MILLNNTPMFLEFLLKNLQDITKQELVKNFYIEGRCNCNQSDCATVYLKKRKTSTFKNLEDSISSSKGWINIYSYIDGYIEIECIGYTYPFKQEVERFFPKNGKLTSHQPRINTHIKKLSQNEKQILKRYFSKKSSIYEKLFLDYKTIDNRKLFLRVK